VEGLRGFAFLRDMNGNPNDNRKIDKKAKKYESKVYMKDMKGTTSSRQKIKIPEGTLFLNFVKTN